MESRRLFSTINLVGTSGDDIILLNLNGSSIDVSFNGSVTSYSGVTGITISGGLGDDDIEISGSITRGATLSGNAGYDTILGGSGGDMITGNTGNDLLDGNSGNDTINGNENNDDIYGGNGNDVLYGGTGADYLSGESGFDLLYPNDAAENGDGATDTLVSDGVDALFFG